MKPFNGLLTAFALAALLAAGLTGCDALTDGYDKDPNLADDAPGDLVLNSAEVGYILFQESQLARNAGIWAGQFTGSDRQYLRLNRYEAIASDYDAMWVAGYADTIGDLGVVKEKARSANQFVLLGIAKILEAHTFGTLADLFGDVPFAEAAAGNDNLNPAFTDQMTVYTSIQDSLSDAIALIEPYTGEDADLGLLFGDTSLEIFYEADPSRWVGAAHTLKARYALHMGNYELAETEAEEGIASAEGNLVAPHGGVLGVNINTYNDFLSVNREGYMTAENAYAPALLQAGSDDSRNDEKTDESARFNYYYAIGLSGEGTLDPNYADGAYTGSESYPILTYVENQLILAEARLQTDGDADGALDALNTARAANNAAFMADSAGAPDVYEPYEAEDFNSGGIANTENESANNALLREILEEKYLSLIGNIEAFTDLRRTDNFIGVPPKVGSRLPERFLYAQIEVNANENTPSPIPGVFEVTPANEAIDYTGVE